MQSTQLSLCAAVKKKGPNVPVFLIYAGIIHAIGLALLLPIMITLPDPGSEIAPETSIIDIEVIPATSDALTIGNVDEQTAALPSVVPVGDGAESGDQAAEGGVANAAPEAQAEPETNEDAEAAAEERGLGVGGFPGAQPVGVADAQVTPGGGVPVAQWA